MIKKLVSLLLLLPLLLLTGCDSNPELPKKPYKEWRISGRYPTYFQVRVFRIAMLSQSNQLHSVGIVVPEQQGDKIGEWNKIGFSASNYVNADLPLEFEICWVSYVDQTFYRTLLEVPLWARQEMVKPHTYYSETLSKNRVVYNNQVILGFAPGGHVTGWLIGVPLPDYEPIKFAEVTSVRWSDEERGDICRNPYENGKIPEISDEGKAWLKKYGMPEHWREPSVE